MTSVTAGTLRARLDARLAIDPGVVVKLNGGGIEATLGGDFYAEGVDGREITFTSIYDDRYGGGGSFDTTSDLSLKLPEPGDWGGLTGGHLSNFSLDNALVAYGGGIIDIEGSFAGFNPVELQQATARIAHSTFENNGSGTGGQAGFDRAGRGFNRPGTIFVRGAQPTIVENDIFGSLGPAISIDLNSLNSESVRDPGRSSFNASADSLIERVTVALDNQGPLIRLNRLSGNVINGMQVRGGTLTNEGVWDDTDIVHVVINESINVSDYHTSGGLRLESSSTESLVVKLNGANAGFTATGIPLDINDRIGGALQILGQPSHPVVITSLGDDSVGAGSDLSGDSQTDTGDVPRGASSTGALRLVEPIPGFGATFVGNVGVSTDGLGTDDVGSLVAAIPDGATVELALLHVATRTTNSPPFQPPVIGFEGQNVPLTYLPNVADATTQLVDFETGTADVTSIVAARAGTLGGVLSFAIDETITGMPDNIEGTSLTVIYSHPDLPLQSVLVLEGGLTGPTPQVTSLDFASPIDTSDPAFVAQLALGIQYGVLVGNAANPQFSTVDINGQRLTSSAGNFDDSIVVPAFDGNLVTVGGVGDSLLNPINPFATDDLTDDELYDLSSFLPDGRNSIYDGDGEPLRRRLDLFGGSVALGRR